MTRPGLTTHTKRLNVLRGYLSTAVKHGRNSFDVLREAIIGQPWIPPDPAPA